mmetsp:Transcript_36910/g.92526  ORF Transcript_36910/g.92526 Transcript_36910/m.92526 type:complete len:132 (+) Transcript_36910:200-595(+)
MSARSASKLVAKEMKELAKLDFHLDQVQVLLPDENNVRELQLLIKPTDGVYKGGSFLFNMSIPDAYPEEPPVFKPVHTLFHPNIDRSVSHYIVSVSFCRLVCQLTGLPFFRAYFSILLLASVVCTLILSAG